MTKYVCAILLLFSASVTHGTAAEIVKIGQASPIFTGVSTEGKTVDLRSLAGRVVLLNFFATWCGPCMTEMPRIESEIWQVYREKGLVVVAVGREHEVAELKEFKQSKRFTFQILADPKREIYSKYASEYIPRCYLLGKNGKVKYAAMGYSPKEFAELKSAIAVELTNE